MRIKSCLLSAAMLAAVSCAQQSSEPKQTYKEDWDDLNRYPQAEWLNELKFGMYYHWNYSTLAHSTDGWYGRNMYNPKSKAYKEHTENFGGPEKFGYKDFEPLFTAEGFSAKEWVDNLERAGGKFMVGMATHHDGFDLYDSSYTEWNSVDKEPHIDIMGELAKESRARGMKFGVTSHLAFNWIFFSLYLYPNNYDAAAEPELYNIHDPEGEPSPEFVDEWYNRTTELIDKYQPDFLWFDFGTKYDGFAKDHTRRLTAHYYNRSVEWGKTVSMASKFGFGNDKSKVHDLEQSKYGYIHYPLWMSDCTMNKGWFYNGMKAVDDTDATGHFWLHQLIDIVSKNGTLLLNLGPKADGSWPEDYTAELFKMGDWLKRNEEAIYYTKPWHRFGEGPTHEVDGSHYKLGAALTSDDIRFTTKDGALYAIMCGWSDNGAAIKSLGTDDMGAGLKIKKISLVGSDAPIKWQQGGEALKIEAPEGVSKDEYAYTFKIEGDGLMPERANEYANAYVTLDTEGVGTIRMTIPGEGAIALTEVTYFDGTASRRSIRTGNFIHSPLAKGEINMVFDMEFNEHPTFANGVVTERCENPWIDFKFKKAMDINYITIFPSMEGGAEFMERGVVEAYDTDGKLIKSVKVADFL